MCKDLTVLSSSPLKPGKNLIHTRPLIQKLGKSIGTKRMPCRCMQTYKWKITKTTHRKVVISKNYSNTKSEFSNNNNNKSSVLQTVLFILLTCKDFYSNINSRSLFLTHTKKRNEKLVTKPTPKTFFPPSFSNFKLKIKMPCCSVAQRGVK